MSNLRAIDQATDATIESLFMAHCAWPIRVSATFLMRKQGVAPTVAIARRRAVCHTH
ncbi:hypothetical protein ACNKHM_27725 [Shigella sonnei]